MVMFFASGRRRVPVQVADEISRLIRRGYAVGDILPRHHALAAQLGVGVRSVTQAVAILSRRGIVSPVRRKGTVVLRRTSDAKRPLGEIAVVPSTPLNLLFAGYLGQIMEGLVARLTEMEANIRFVPPRQNAFPTPQEVRSTGVDGVVLLGIPDESYLRLWARQDVPVVVLDYYRPDIPLDYVVCDNAGAARAIVEHLARSGHRTLAYISLPLSKKEDSDITERHEAVDAAAAACGVRMLPAFSLPGKGPLAPRGLAELVAALRAPRTRPTALVADCSSTASIVTARLRADGILAPRDVAMAIVAGSRNPEAEGLLAVPSCVMDFTGMGALGLDILAERARSAAPAAARIARVGFTFDPGELAVPARKPPRPGGRRQPVE